VRYRNLNRGESLYTRLLLYCAMCQVAAFLSDDSEDEVEPFFIPTSPATAGLRHAGKTGVSN
jgi:hypothetical protein